MNVLVTGGSGLIGYALAKKLLSIGYKVYSTSGGNGNSAVGNVVCRGLFGINVHDLPPKIDCLFHNAAINDTRCMNLSDLTRINVEESMRIFSMCYYRGCRKFVYASSAAVYGNSPAPYVEDKTPLNPLTPYAQSKLELEKEAADFGKNKNVQTVGFRYCNVYGPGESHKGARASMVHQLLCRKRAGLSPRLYRDGSQKRDWLHVTDAATANVLAMQSDVSGIFNIGSGRSVSFTDLVTIIFGEAAVEWVDCPFPQEYQDHTCCDYTKAEKAFGFKPSVEIINADLQ